ncbi:hypothetical protein EVA_14305 [gut metagenome]|uniref:Uncharacterized protein n=1 Tax=gut metagenome TaxID=749906 RepID=J9G746_9ZZZZ
MLLVSATLLLRLTVPRTPTIWFVPPFRPSLISVARLILLLSAASPSKRFSVNQESKTCPKRRPLRLLLLRAPLVRRLITVQRSLVWA